MGFNAVDIQAGKREKGADEVNCILFSVFVLILFVSDYLFKAT